MFFFPQSQTTNAFARKFEAIVNQEIITMLDAWLYGDYPKDLPGLHNYWESVFDERYDPVDHFDIKMTFFQSLARQVTSLLTENSNCLVSQIWKAKEAHYFFGRDKLRGVLVKFDVKIVGSDKSKELVVFETWAKRINMTILANKNTTEPASRLKGLEVC